MTTTGLWCSHDCPNCIFESPDTCYDQDFEIPKWFRYSKGKIYTVKEFRNKFNKINTSEEALIATSIQSTNDIMFVLFMIKVNKMYSDPKYTDDDYAMVLNEKILEDMTDIYTDTEILQIVSELKGSTDLFTDYYRDRVGKGNKYGESQWWIGYYNPNRKFFVGEILRGVSDERFKVMFARHYKDKSIIHIIRIIWRNSNDPKMVNHHNQKRPT